MPHHLERLAELEPVDVDEVGLVRSEAGEHLRRPVDGVAPHPRTRPRAARSPSKPALATSTPWHPASTQPSVGSSRTAKSPASSSGRDGEHLAQPVELVAHLFAFVEREGDVVARRRRIVVQPLGQAEQHRQAALHVGRARARGARRRRAGAPRCPRWRGRCRDDRRARPRRARPSSVRTIDVGADPVEGQRRRPRPQPRLDQIGELGLVVALRPHRDQRGGEAEEIDRRRRRAPPYGSSCGRAVVAQDVVEPRPCRDARPR